MIGALPEAIFLCITPSEYGGEMETTMSPVMYEAYPAMEKLLLDELAGWQVTPVRREVAK